MCNVYSYEHWGRVKSARRPCWRQILTVSSQSRLEKYILSTLGHNVRNVVVRVFSGAPWLLYHAANKIRRREVAASA